MHTEQPLRVLSYGGGLDSFAMLLLAIENNELPDLVVFADVTDDARLDPGEWPGTYQHIDEVVRPLCAQHGIEFVRLSTTDFPIRGKRSLFAYFEDMHLMPARISRLCTSASKVERVAEYLHGRYGDRAMVVSIGFEAGEEKRAERDPHAAGTAKGPKRGRKAMNDLNRTNRFPLIEAGLCRCRCESLVRRSGLAVPRKSACVFCPFGTRGDFQTVARELPEQFVRIEQLEANCKLSKSGQRIRFAGSGEVPELRAWAMKPYQRKLMACGVCGASVRATKAVACGYLDDGIASPCAEAAE